MLRIDNALNLIYVKGAVPGVDHAVCRVRDTLSGGNEQIFSANPPPYPTFIPKPGQRLPRLMTAGPEKAEHVIKDA